MQGLWGPDVFIRVRMNVLSVVGFNRIMFLYVICYKEWIENQWCKIEDIV